MNQTSIEVYDQLHAYIEGLPTINCHEHLPAFDKEFDNMNIDLFNDLGYIMDDLHSAGITDEEIESLLGKEDIWHKWLIFKRYYPFIKYTSYGRGFRIMLKDFFDGTLYVNRTTKRV